MIFPHTYTRILAGTKTQTRRPVQEGDYAWSCGWDIWWALPVRMHSSICEKSGRVRFRRGKTYAVRPGRGKPVVGRIRITALRREDVRDISDDDVCAEGFNSREEFLALWERMHGQQYMAWVIEFELITVNEDTANKRTG